MLTAVDLCFYLLTNLTSKKIRRQGSQSLLRGPQRGVVDVAGMWVGLAITLIIISQAVYERML